MDNQHGRPIACLTTRFSVTNANVASSSGTGRIRVEESGVGGTLTCGAERQKSGSLSWLVLPAVRTELTLGQKTIEPFMPLEMFVDQVMRSSSGYLPRL